MKYLNCIIIETHKYILGAKKVEYNDFKPKFTKQPRTHATKNTRTHEIYGIENPTMPNMHLTRHEWRQLGKHQRAKRTGRQWQIEDYCKYCTDFLIERPQEEAEDPCVQCGIRDALQEEREQSKAPDFILRKSSAKQPRGDM